MGFEPMTPTLARLCSAVELHPRRAGRDFELPSGLHPDTSRQHQQILAGPFQLLCKSCHDSTKRFVETREPGEHSATVYPGLDELA
jgi:hypothetical protein